MSDRVKVFNTLPSRTSYTPMPIQKLGVCVGVHEGHVGVLPDMSKSQSEWVKQVNNAKRKKLTRGSLLESCEMFNIDVWQERRERGTRTWGFHLASAANSFACLNSVKLVHLLKYAPFAARRTSCTAYLKPKKGRKSRLCRKQRYIILAWQYRSHP